MSEIKSRIAIFCYEIGGYSGVGQSAITILRSLAALESALTLITSIQNRKMKPGAAGWAILAAIPRIYLPAKKKSLRDSVFGAIKEVGRRLQEQISLFSLGRAALYDFDLMLINGIHDAFIFRASCIFEKITARKTVIVIHQSPDFFVEKELQHVLELLASADMLLSVSKTVLSEWRLRLENHGLSMPSAMVIPNVVLESALNQARNAPAFLWKKPDAVKIICVGGLMHRKGQDVLIEACRDLVRLEKNFEVILVGPRPLESEWVDELLAKIDRWSLRFCVHWVGPQENPLRHMATADLLVLPSRAEALPRVIIEAMSMGLPCIGTRVAGIPELIEDEFNGLLVDPGKPDALVNALSRLIDNELERKVFGMNGRRKFKDQYSEKALTDQLKLAVSNVLAER